jgi:short-subunit dehydrogenase
MSNPACIAARLWLLPALLVLMTGCASTRLSSADAQSVAGKTYVVTGASSGIGRGTALKLASMKANVVLAARRTAVLEQVADEVRKAGGTPLVQTVDVAREEDMRRLADATVARFGRIDVWINNAGVGAIGPFEKIPLADHSRVVDVNLKGVIYGSHVALALFKKQNHGRLINVGSVESEVPLAYQASYSATKAGVLALGRALNEEIRLANRQDTISVSTVMPWATDTPFFEHAANYSGGKTQMAAMDDPQKPIDAIVHASIYPREEISVGWKGKFARASHLVMPDATEASSGAVSHHYQVDTPPPANATSGTLFQPMEQGQGVDGGVRQRMRDDKGAGKQAR